MTSSKRFMLNAKDRFPVLSLQMQTARGRFQHVHVAFEKCFEKKHIKHMLKARNMPHGEPIHDSIIATLLMSVQPAKSNEAEHR